MPVVGPVLFETTNEAGDLSRRCAPVKSCLKRSPRPSVRRGARRTVEGTAAGSPDSVGNGCRATFRRAVRMVRSVAEDTDVLVSHRARAFAGACQNPVHIEDSYLAAPVGNQAFVLHLNGYRCHAGASNSHHLPKKLLCQRQFC